MSKIQANQIQHTQNGAAVFTLPTSDGSTGQVMKTDGSGALSFVAQPAAGITEADQWRVTSNFTMGTTAANITSNWERNDTTAFQKIGTGMSVDSSTGRFTFPSTGIYLISAFWQGQRATGNTYSGTVYMYGTTNNFSSNFSLMESWAGSGTNYELNNAYMSCIFDVEDTSTHKCFVGYYDYHHGSMVFYGNTNTNYNAFTFIKLGDT